MTGRSPTPCPTCRETTVAEIVYGMLDHEGYLALGEGAVIGGCCVTPERWRCTACDGTWTTESPPRSGR